MSRLDNLYKQEWYGEKARIIAQNQNYTVSKYGCNGKGIITTYQVFDGIQVVFIDFETSDTFIPETPHNDIIEISWCRKGRVECEFANRTHSHLQEGDFWVEGANYIPVSYSFPFSNFEAVSLVIDKRALTEKSKRMIAAFSIDIYKTGNNLGLDKSMYICRTDKNLKHLFDEIYKAKGVESVSYFSIKTLELLYHAEQLTGDSGCEIKYFSREQIQTVKRIHEQLTSDLEQKYSLEELVSKEHIGMTMFQTIFRQIYGDSPYSYLKKYKMGIAAKLLMKGNLKIGEIAISLGYNNASKFAAAFKDVYGMLPKDYRKSNDDLGSFKSFSIEMD